MNRLLAIGAAIACVGAFGLVTERPGNTATTGELLKLSFGSDTFYNFDFTGTTASSTRVDFPMTVIFRQNSSVNRAKSRMETWSNRFDGSSSDSMHAQLRDGDKAPFHWDSDRGKKSPTCPASGQSSPHYRVYGIGSQERLYNTSWGYWNPASTHRDYNECPPIRKRHSNSEEVEDLVAAEVDENTTVSRDRTNFFNREYRKEGNHTIDSNGYATHVSIR